MGTITYLMVQATEDWMTYLTSALKTLANFSALALPQQIMFLIVLVAVTLILITMSIVTIANFFKAEAIRREEAYKEAERIRKEREKNLERLQSEASQAFLDNIDAAYRQDYDYYKEKISQGDIQLIWGKIPKQYQEDIASFVYREDLKPEEKSARIILVVKGELYGN